MAEQDDEPVVESGGAEVPGPRRSTFTPPAAAPAPPDLHDDDELAAALADDLTRLYTGPVGTSPGPAEQAPDAPAAALAPPTPAWGAFTPVTPAAPADPAPVEPAADVAPTADAADSGQAALAAAEPSLPPAWDAPAEPLLAEAEPPLPGTMPAYQPSPPMPTAPPAWVTAPAPDPAEAVPLDGPPQAPQRRSLGDEELSRWVEQAGQEPGSTLQIIEQMQAQLQLREEEAREFGAWESTMRTLGTPEALAAIEEARPNFSGVLPAVTVPASAAAPEPPASPAATGEPSVFEIPMLDADEREREVEEIFGFAPAEESADPEVEAEPDAGGAVAVEPDPESEAEPESGSPAEPWPPAEPVFWAEPESPVEVEPESPVEAEPPLDAGSPAEPEPEPEPDPEQAAFWAPPPLIEPPSEPAASAPSPSEFSFDDLLAGAGEELIGSTEPAESAAPEVLFIEPVAATADGAVPTDTDTVRIVDRAYEEDFADDAVDDIDRVLAGGELAPVEPPSGPIPTSRIPEDELVLLEDEPALPGIFSLEAAGAEPTPVQQRAAWSSRLFWMWFAANSSILSLGLGAVVFAIGLSLRQAIVAVFVGVALSFLPLGLSTLAGKRSGQPVMVVSRAVFGLLGNILPALLALATRVFWGAVMLWLLASAVAIVLAGAELDAGLGEGMLLIIGLAAGLLLAAGTAFLGFGLLARLNVVLAVISGLLIVGLVAMTASYLDLDEALTNPDGPWILTVTGAVLVFSFIGMVWAHSGGDLARYQSGQSSGAGAMLSSSFGATLPAVVLVGYGALLAASNKGIAQGFVTAPLDTLALMLPNWYPVPLLAATALSLLAGIIVTLYSGGFALQSLGLRLARPWAVLLVAALTGAIAALLAFGVTGLTEIFRDLATTLAVPTAAWVGLLSAELMIRNRRFASSSLLSRGGVYPDVNWVNSVAFVAISAIGLGLTSASVSWLSWQGYLFGLLGQPLDSDLAGTDLGVIVALVLGLLVPIALGIPAIRRQEAVEAD